MMTTNTFHMKNIISLLVLFFFVHVSSFAQVNVSGIITTEEGGGVEGVLISAGPNGPTVETDINGTYQLTLEEGEDYTLTPIKNYNMLNGVTTLDLVLIDKHIDGVQNLDSPYKIIAADINHSDDITSSDLMDLYSSILLFNNFFPNNTSWRFVPSDFVFADPQDPFSVAFPEVIQLNNLTDDLTDLNFTGVKIGDVNGSAIPSGNNQNAANGLITGTIFFDEDNDCLKGTGEQGLSDWYAFAEAPSGQKYWGFTNNQGTYYIYAPPGIYDVAVIEPNELWQACADTVAGVEIFAPSLSIVDFGVQAVDECPNMDVHLGTTFLRRCFENNYFIYYANKGTEEATGTYIEVTLDTFFTDVSSSIPWSSVDGQTYTFDIGNVAISESGFFSITFTLDCDAELGQTHCSSAYIFPEPPCTPVSNQWAGGDIEITAECDGTDVNFIMTNHGSPLTEPVNYIVIEDIMIQMTGESGLLNTGESEIITQPANGSTWRLLANEVNNHPFETIATTAVEGCGLNGSGSFSLGFINQFPFSDEEPFMDEDCQENRGAFDPNDKTGYPLGYDEEHFIERGQDISYRIRFQNTGTDTAFHVVVLDTLPEELDPASLRIESFSHPMEFFISPDGIMQFKFAEILLPDSTTNEPASHGFIKFLVSQKEGLELGTTIENSAAIYFDFNEPIITNHTLHTLGEPMIEVTTTKVIIPEVDLNVYPNPFKEQATFELKGMDIENGQFQLFNQNGQLVKTQRLTSNNFVINGADLPTGFYFYQISSQHQPIANGKIVVR